MKKRRCPECNSAMTEYLLDEHTKLHLCGNNPDCAAFAFEDGAFKIKGYEGPTLACDKCGSEMQLKTGRFGKYFGCTGKVEGEACKNTRKLLRNGEAAPPKMDPVPMPELQCEKVEDTYLLRDGAAGLFLAASQFPKNRETRAPYIDELLPHQNEIDPKYQFLMKAPVSDPEGRRSLVKFSRIEKQHYVASEIERGKASGWRADYDESAGQWIEKVTTKAKAAPKRKRAASKRKQSA